MKVLEGAVTEARAQVAGAVAAAQARGGPAAVKVGGMAGVEQAWPTEETTVSTGSPDRSPSMYARHH